MIGHAEDDAPNPGRCCMCWRRAGVRNLVMLPPGYFEGLREMGRRAAANGAPIKLIDDSPLIVGNDRWHWRAGWREQMRKQIGLKVVR